MTRALWKGPFCELDLHESGLAQDHKIWSRRSVVLPEFLGREFAIHNGETFIRVRVVREMIGHKFGEFATTRKRAVHKKKTKR